MGCFERTEILSLLLDLHRDSNMGLRCSFIVPLALVIAT